MSTLIDEEEVRSALRDDAERYAVPPSGPHEILAAIRTGATSAPGGPVSGGPLTDRALGTRGRRRTTMALAAVAATVVLALVIASTGGGRATDTTATRPGQGSGPTPATAPASQFGSAEKLSPTTTLRSSSASAGSSALGAPDTRGTPSGKRQATPDSAGSEKIVKTGSIELEVPRGTFSDRVTQLTLVAKGLGGFVAQTSTSEQGVAPTGTITLRVPAGQFEPLLARVRPLGRVLSATSGARDVTSEYTDVTGRLKTMQNERDALGLVLTDAKNVPDILAVRDRLNVVQAEIEQLEGRRRVLDDQTSLATLTVSLREPAIKPAPRPHPPAKQSGLERAWHRAVAGFNGGVESIVAGSGKVLLVGLCAAALWMFGRPVWHRFRRALL